MLLSAQRQAIEHLCDVEKPTSIPGDREMNVVDAFTDDLRVVYPIGETTAHTRKGLVKLLVYSSRPPAVPYTPQYGEYAYACLLYRTSPDALQQRKTVKESERIHNLTSGHGEPEPEEGLLTVEQFPSPIETDKQWLEPTTWDQKEKENDRHIFWFAGVMIDDREPNVPQTLDMREKQRQELSRVPRLQNHLEPLLILSVTKDRAFAILSDNPYSYADM